MEQYRRYGRWIKRIAFFLVAYVLIGYLFIGVTPGQALLHPGASLAGYRQMVVYLIFIGSLIVLQFVAMFAFLARGNSYTIYPGEYDVSFEDVRGQQAAVNSTKEVLRLFNGFKDFRQMGGYPPHGILFEGPPGTGKTLMAKAIAGASGVPFLYATGSGFANMFVGIGNLKVRRLFTKARNMSDKYGGAVIFIDELDALGGSRGAISDSYSAGARDAARPDRVVMGGMGMGGGLGIVNELLVQMDGLIVPRGLWRHVRRLFGAKPKVPFYNILIIGATNRAQTLDPALLRPGRFDRKIHVGLPDYEGRADIAKYYLRKVRHEPIDYSKLARMTVGYSPALLKNIVNEALIFALQDGRDALRWDDLWQAKLTEEIGLKQPVRYPEKERISVATHEGAHAVASYILEKGERQIQVVTIQKREDTLGLVHGQPLEEFHGMTQRQILARLQVGLAGLVSEEIWFGQVSTGATSDLANATRLAAMYVGAYGMGKSLVSSIAAQPSMFDGDPVSAVLADGERRKEVDALLEESRRRVRALLLEKRHVVEGLRDALLQREELIGDEIEAVMADLGEREPLDIPVGALSGNGHGGTLPSPLGNGHGNGDAPPRPDTL
jgi:cell division protease FtsH